MELRKHVREGFNETSGTATVSRTAAGGVTRVLPAASNSWYATRSAGRDAYTVAVLTNASTFATVSPNGG